MIDRNAKDWDKQKQFKNVRFQYLKKPKNRMTDVSCKILISAFQTIAVLLPKYK